MDGENNGDPYFLMDDLGGKPPIFGNARIYLCRFWSPPPPRFDLPIVQYYSNTKTTFHLPKQMPAAISCYSLAHIELRHGCQYWLCLIWWYTLKVSRWKL